MSQAGPCGRSTPRWSVRGQPAPLEGTWSIAALPAPSAIVWVAPPLSASDPSLGSPFIPGQLASSKLRLWPPSVSTLLSDPELVAQFPPPSLATIVFWRVSPFGSPVTNRPPPTPALPTVPLAPLGTPVPPVPAAPRTPTPLAATVTFSREEPGARLRRMPPPLPPAPPFPPWPPWPRLLPEPPPLPPWPPAPPAPAKLPPIVLLIAVTDPVHGSVTQLGKFAEIPPPSLAP